VGVVITVAAVVLAIYGHDWLHRVFRVLLWLSLPFWLALTLGVLAGQAGGRAPAAGGFTLVAFMTQFTVCASYNVTYAPYVSDYTRYLPRRVGTPRIVASVFVGAAASPVWLIPIGAWLATRLGATDTLVGIRDAGNAVVDGLGGVLAVLAVLALVATMGLNAYSGMLTVVTGVDSFRKVTPTRRIRVVTVVGLGVVWAVIGIGLINDFSSALSNAQLIMLYLLTPWTAINLVDYFFVRRGHYAITDLFRPDGIYGAWAWRGLVSYGAGLASMIPFVALTFFTGPVAELFNKVDVAFLVGLAVSAGLYFALTRNLDLAAEQPAVDRSERDLATM
jgi:nucleobase:cation symporter-1, NCS1 family